MKKYPYIIIGGGIAGGEAVKGIREVDEDGDILLISAEPHRPYQRPPLSKSFLRKGKGLDEKVYLESKSYYEENNVILTLGVSVEAIDRHYNRINLSDGRIFSYKKLLLATGGSATSLPIRNTELENIFTLRTIEDSKAIHAAAQQARQACVIGGSFIGAEAASALAQSGVEVMMVFPDTRILEGIAPPALGEYLESFYAGNGVRIHSGSRPAAFLGSRNVEQVELENGKRLEADLVVMGIGIDLNNSLAKKSRIETREDGGVLVNRMLRTSDPNIYAAGDIAAWTDATFEKRLRVEHWDVAKNQGRVAGRNMAGDSTPFEKLPYFFSDLFDLSFEAWGDLDDWDHTVLRGQHEEKSFAHFYFSGGRLVGALAAGRPSEEREAIPDLVSARPKLEAIEDRLADPSADLEMALAEVV